MLLGGLLLGCWAAGLVVLGCVRFLGCWADWSQPKPFFAVGLDPLVGLALGIDAQGPAPALVDDDPVLDGEGVVGQAADGPAPDLHRLTQAVLDASMSERLWQEMKRTSEKKNKKATGTKGNEEAWKN